MKTFQKFIGLIMIIVAALALVLAFVTESSLVNSNPFLFGMAALIVIGLVTYILLNKRITE